MKTYRTTTSAIVSRFDSFERVKVQLGIPGSNGLNKFLFADVKSASRQLPDRSVKVPVTVRESSDGKELTILADGTPPAWFE